MIISMVIFHWKAKWQVTAFHQQSIKTLGAWSKWKKTWSQRQRLLLFYSYHSLSIIDIKTTWTEVTKELLSKNGCVCGCNAFSQACAAHNTSLMKNAETIARYKLQTKAWGWKVQQTTTHSQYCPRDSLLSSCPSKLWKSHRLFPWRPPLEKESSADAFFAWHRQSY